MYRNLLVLLLTFLVTDASAQSGASCDSAITLSVPLVSLPAESSLGFKWYQFVPDSGQFEITINSFDRGDSAVQGVNIYSGTCGTPTFISTLSKISFPIIYGKFVNNSNGTTYFIEVVGSNVTSSNYSLQVYVQPTLVSAPCSCPSTLINANVTCDYICNGSFEYLTSQITGPQQLDHACPWRDPLPYASSCDIFSTNTNNSNFAVPNNGLGSETAHTGVSYAGFAPFCHPTWGQQAILDPDYKEYLCTPLTQPLVLGQCYTLTFYLSLAENSRFASGNFGVFFSTNPASQTGTFTQYINASPQILFSAIQTSTNWIQYTATYNAVGGESYMTIGNFQSNISTPITSLGYVNTNPNQILNYSAWSYYFIDDISLTPCCNGMAVGSFPIDLCYGDQVTLAASCVCPNITYSWSPTANITGSTTAPLTTATVTGSQVYTCQVTLASYGCTISASTTVNMNVTPVVNAGPDVTICEGQSVTLTGTGASTSYGWEDPGGTNICTGCSTLTVNPAGTTSYVYYAYNSHSGCYGRDEVTVTVLPAPDPLIVSPPGAVTCDNAFTFSVTGGPYPNYLWSTNATTFTSLTQSTVTADWINSYTPPDGYMNVTVTASNGCTGTATVTIPHCCCGAHVEVVNDDIDDILADNPGVLQLIGGNYVMSTTDMCINGIFTVNHNLILHNVKVYMGTNAKIVVAPGVLFRLEGNGPGLGNQTVIQACDRMWDGIYVDGTNSASLLDIRDGTIIEDAHRAIVSSNGGNFQITGSLLQGPVKLNKNDTAIWIKPYAFLHPCSITNTIFSSDAPGQTGGTPTVTSAGNNCIAPVNKRAKAGIVIETATVNIGNPISIARRNIFERVQFGIVATSSTVTVRNNRFINIDRLIGVPFSGYAIYATANKSTNGLMNVGGNVPLDSNNFTNCNVGISCNNYVSLNCENNGFFNAPNLALVGTYAIGMFTCNSQTCNILNNRMARWRTGIWLLDNSLLVADIRSNFINVRPTLNLPVPNSNALYGIRINNAVQLPMQLTIRQNEVTHCRIGIELINVLTSTSQLVAKVRYNNIGFDFNAAIFNANICFGIRVVNSPEMQIDVNTICYNYNMTTSGPIPTIALANQCRGIHVENSNNVEVTNNYCNRLGAGIWMEAICPASRIACNHLVRNWNGVHLNMATIGDQYSLLPNDNRYSLTPPGVHSVNSDIDGLVLSSTTWYYRNNLGAWFIPTLNIFAPFFPVPNNGPTLCGPPAPPSAAMRSLFWFSIVTDTITYSSNDLENRHNGKQLAYRYFQNNPNMLVLNSSDDSIYLGFQSYLHNSSLGQLKAVHDSIATGNYQDAASINNGITPVLPFDESMRIVNDIYLQTWAIGNRFLSPVDSATLLLIALSDPVILGPSVYSAQVMLDTCGVAPATNRLMSPESQDSPPAVNLFPIPADQSVNLDYPVMQDQIVSYSIVNSLGQNVTGGRLVTGVEHLIPLLTVPDGFYLLQIVIDGEIVSSDKIIVRHAQ